MRDRHRRKKRWIAFILSFIIMFAGACVCLPKVAEGPVTSEQMGGNPNILSAIVPIPVNGFDLSYKHSIKAIFPKYSVDGLIVKGITPFKDDT